MPIFTTSVKLISATKKDYDGLSKELIKKSFKVSPDKEKYWRIHEHSIIFSSNQSSLLDVAAAVSEAASHTGKKFTFSVMKEKTSL